ncbi:MAG: hypothetical protein Q8S00_28530 [Deltaproteobacteria bacterium]|nr:hypothetical protein [Deltaproteobacteria bacterium]MDZ4347558.1 hypothetical protein [Candidatus Binatia bacterium]
MKEKLFVLVLIVMCGVLIGTFRVSASTFTAASDGQLACEATDIIQGQVIDVRSAWDEERVAIWTTATVQVQGNVKGKMVRDGVVEVKEVGGTVNGFNITAIGFPTFRKGEEVVMLLRPWEDNATAFRVWGYGRGMYNIARDGRQAAVAHRYDTRGTGKATMFTDRIPPIVPLDRLNRELAALAKNCK